MSYNKIGKGDPTALPYGLSNSEIDRLIKKHYKNEKCRNILHDRIINEMLWKDIVKKYYTEYEFASERRVLAKCRQVAELEYAFIKSVREYDQGNEL